MHGVRPAIDVTMQSAAETMEHLASAYYGQTAHNRELDGQPVDGFLGAVPESQVKDFVQKELAPYAVGIAGGSFDPREVVSGLALAGNRAGLLACGSAATAVHGVLQLSGKRRLAEAKGDPAVADLLRFAVSEDHVFLRGAGAG